MKWTGFQPSDEIACFAQAAKASDVKDFREAFRDFKMMPQHLMAFDLDGNIIHIMPGSIPIRNGFSGEPSKPGWDSKFEWSGFMPYDRMPSPMNPLEGFLNNSNDYPYCCKGLDLGANFPLPARAERVREILSSRNDFTLDDMRMMQVDLLNPVARKLLPMMLKQLEGLDVSQCKDEFEMLQSWDYRETPDSVTATIYNEWWVELPKHIFSKLGIYSMSYRDSLDQCTLAMEELFTDGKKSPLWDWLELGSEMDFKLKCLMSLQIAVRTLQKDYGSERSNWEWGKVHKSHFAHPSKVEFLLDGGSYGVGGSRNTLLVSHYFPSMGFESTFGPTYRILATIDDKGRIIAQSVLPPGDWAAPLSSHFKDQAQMWVDGKLKELKVYPDEMRTLPLAFIMRP
jgi:penicillin amidase